MLGEQVGQQDRLFYEFDLEERVPSDHLLRRLDAVLDLSWLRAELLPFYSPTGRPSIDPELMMRMLLVGYCYSIRSERRLCQEVELTGAAIVRTAPSRNNVPPAKSAELDAGKPWELEDVQLVVLREKIIAGHKPLKDVYGDPLYGIKTGCNDAFVIDQAKRDALVAEDSNSLDLLHPFLEGRDLKRWCSESRNLWIIYIPKNKVDIDDYPAVKAHLEVYKDRLEKRATKQKWFELQQAQLAYSPYFLKTKISYPHFSKRSLFQIESSGYFSNDKSYLIPSSDHFLLALLNSSTLWFMITALAPAVRGGFHELRVQYLQILPIPVGSNKQKAELAALALACQTFAEERLKIQLSLVRRIPDLCPEGLEPKLSNNLKSWWEFDDFTAFHKEIKKVFKADIPLSERSDWEDWIAKEKSEVLSLTSAITASEDKINALVYQLFGLTDDEIQLLEANIQEI